MTVHNLLRRGMDIVALADKSQHDDDNDKPMNPLALMVITLTFLAFLFLMFTISYTYGHVIPTLCMIETPSAQAYVPVNAAAAPDAPPAYDAVPKPDDEEADVLLVQNKPITTSIRATILHLRAKAGYWSRFRGLSVFLVWNFIRSLITNIIGAPFMHPIGFAVAAIIAETLLARLHLTWVHIVISEPSTKPWYRRVPPWNTWKKIAPAVALLSVCTQITVTMPLLVTGSFGAWKHMQDPEYEPGTGDLYASGGQAFFAFLVFIALFVGIQIPALVTMVRVAASMLPEEDETIVEFDRSFQGRTTPEIIGGQGKIGIVEAWKSYPRTSRIRLLKLMAKVAAISAAAWMFFVMVLVAETHLLLGENVGAFMRAVHGRN
ncbi:uncharacterized protein HMPREF1541_03021 [Cyphellophora europaea CBS 101466]|uniref:Ubiquitin carrier protein n=1 Tax=Cyphellophora europaea (strain CBS 101466) TaxID=1220924 RepID=W2RX45_CYPE1|nr:uncharacterized protein HMPREF1541_03021 [Cyphellophora europaea CBS 101466]ETN41086.1 hypothetical protein HMPREF1541_03021 [Cyphellophora europaea CBS 101466]